LERPKVIYNKKNDQYVMWFHLEPRGAGYSGALSGVAVSKNVAGPYSFVNAFRPNAGFWPVNVQELHKQPCTLSADLRFSGGELPAHPDSLNLLGRDQISGQMARDMNLFVDDDGIAYHIYSSEENSTLHISQLTDDYTSYSGKYARFFPGRFMEAPALFKQKGKYYLIMSGCTGWAPNAGRSAVASSIWGPWKELENPFRGENSEVSFYSQSTYVLPVPGHADRFIYMGDRWTPENAIDGRYIWLPIRFEGEQPVIEWRSEWSY
jgi:licheninase